MGAMRVISLRGGWLAGLADETLPCQMDPGFVRAMVRRTSSMVVRVSEGARDEVDGG